MRPRTVAFSILGIISIIGIINSILGNIVAALLQERLGVNAGIVIIPFVALAAILIGYEMRGQLPNLLGQDSSNTSQRQRLNRDRMIEKVEATWIKGFLETSLYKITKIELQLENDPTFIEFPWEGVVQRTNLPDHSINSSKDVYKVFKELGEELIILGAPGSGKTTLLLELAKDLLGEARKKGTAPIPVVFNLSTWSINRKHLDLWLIDELNSKYDVPLKLAREWVENNAIMALLDGLDEVQQNFREQCVDAINIYRKRDDFIPIVVCCRTTDYQLLREKLRFQNAIAIKPISKKEIRDYFRHQSLKGVEQQIKEDPQLLEFLDNPLMLNIVALAFGKGNVEFSLPTGTTEQQRDYIFDTYVDSMFARRIKVTKYKREYTLKSLSWLAHVMHNNSQTVFHVERLQPEWLETRSSRYSYILLDRFVWPILFGILVGFVGLLIASYIDKHNLEIFFVNTSRRDVFGYGFFPEYAVLTAILTILCGAVFGSKNLTGFNIRERIKDAVLGTLTGGIVGFLSPVFFHWKAPNFLDVVYMSFQQLYAFTGGLVGFIASLVSGRPSLQLRHIYPIERIRWSPSAAFYLSSYSVLFLFSVSTVFNLITGFPFLVRLTNSLLVDSLLQSFIIGALTGVIGGLNMDEIEVKSFPNQGITRSGVIFGLMGPCLIACSGVVGLIIGGFIEANPGNIFFKAQFYFGNSYFDNLRPVGGVLAGLITGLSEIVPIAIAVALAYGGYAFFSHYALRILLWINGKTPLFYVEFLDYCVDRIFLRKVGGGYAFVHRLLLEWFAKQRYPK